MPRTRLNKEKREILMTYMEATLENFPVDKQRQDEYKQSVQTFAKVHDRMTAAVVKEAARGITPAERKVLLKYNIFRKTPSANLKFGEHYTSFNFFNEAVWLVDNPRPPRRSSDLDKWWLAYHAASEAAAQLLPYRFNSSGISSATICMEQYQSLYDTYREAQAGVKLCFERLREKEASVRQALTTLISSANTYEDVVAVWDDAKTVAAQVVNSERAVSVLSTDAVELIRSLSAKAAEAKAGK